MGEKTAIQVLDTMPVLPMSPGRAERQGFECYRHRTRSLIAALSTHTGEVLGKMLSRVGGEPFFAFLSRLPAPPKALLGVRGLASNSSLYHLFFQV